MRKQILALALILGCTFAVESIPAQTRGPFVYAGLTRNGPQPFSTRRSRQAQAARYQRLPGAYGVQRTQARTFYAPQFARPNVQWPSALAGPAPRQLLFRNTIRYR